MATGNGKQFFSKRARWTVCFLPSVLFDFANIQNTQCTGCQRRTRAYRNSLALCNACQTTFTGFTEGHASGPDIRNARTKNPAHQETGTTIKDKAWEETSKDDSERRKSGQSDKRPTNLEIRHTPRQDSPLHRRPYTQPEFEDELRSATKKPDDALTLVSVLTSPNRTSLSKPLLEPLSGPQKEHIHPRRDKPACSVATPNKTRRMNLAPPFDEQRKDPVKPFAPHQSQGGCKVEPSNRVSEHKQRHTVVQSCRWRIITQIYGLGRVRQRRRLFQNDFYVVERYRRRRAELCT